MTIYRIKSVAGIIGVDNQLSWTPMIKPMKSFYKRLFILLTLFVTFLLPLSSLALAAGGSSTTRVLVIEGETVCFDLPEEFAGVEEGGETRIGKFYMDIDEETCKVFIKGEIVRCYKPQKFRYQIGDRLQEGVYIFAVRNTRRLKQTQWDLVSVGTVVLKGQVYSEGKVARASPDESLEAAKGLVPEPSVSTSAPVSGTTSVEKDDQALVMASGEGAATPPSPPPIPTTPPSEPTPPPPSGDGDEDGDEEEFYYIDPTNGDNSNNGSSDNPWRTITHAIANVDSTVSTTIYLCSGTYQSANVTGSPDTGEDFPLFIPDGFTLRGYTEDGSSTSDIILDGTDGGTLGIIACQNVSITIRDITVRNGTGQNGESGGITVGNSTATISNCIIGDPDNDALGNTAQQGGGIAIDDSTVTLTNCYIWRNTATSTGAAGGGIKCNESTLNIENCTISNNSATNGRGGGIWTGSAALTIDSSTFSNNTSASVGGALDWSGTDGMSSLTITDSSFTSNSSSSDSGGGGISLRNQGVSATIERCKFESNTATNGTSGGIFVNCGNTSITNCLFIGNRCMSRGAAIGVCTTATVTNCTVASNFTVAPNNTGSICLWGTGSSLTLVNTIVANNTGIGVSCGNDTVTNCDFYNNKKHDGTDAEVGYNGTDYDNIALMDTTEVNCSNNTGADPQLKGGTDYHIGSGSPCINAGTSSGAPSDDLEGRPRSGNPDIGCYEYVTGDPPITGRVYDSVTGVNISSPVVAIYNATTNAQVSVTTSNPYTFNVNPGSYYVAVSKTGYAFPSQIVDSVVSGDHGDIFTASDSALTIDIPMDTDGWLYVEKTCNKKRVEIGDIVTYRIKVQNKHWYKAVKNVELVDELVNGFKYISGSTYSGTSQFTDDSVQITDHKAIFNLGTVSANSTTTISYQVRVGTGIPPGRYRVAAHTRKSTTGERNSNTDSTSIEVVENPLFTKGTIIGKVFWDFNGNGVQDSGELGLPGVKIYTEYGVVVETDEVGKYHIADVPAGNHLLKVDTNQFSIPIELTTDNPYYVKITEGLLAKVNFGVDKKAVILNPEGAKDPVLEYEIPHSVRNDGSGESKFFIVALAEGIVRNLDTSGNIAMVDKDDRYDDGVRVDGRLALYLKGKILGKFLITASVDTERKPGGRYDTRRLFTNLDPDKYYPVYGDASKVDYSGVDTQDVVYVLIEWDESFAKWGSFHTELPLYNRTLSGGIVNYKSVSKTKFGDTRTQIKGFGAFSRQKPAHDEFVGTGGSLYYLRHTDIIEGSEKLRVEVRDRTSRITISSIPLCEEKDYEIDYDRGRILLRKPLNSIQQPYNNSIISNDILMGERVYLIVDYEYYSDGLSEQAWGVNASQWIGNHIRVGGTYVQEQKPGDDYKLAGGDATLKLNRDTQINVSYSHTEETQLGSDMSYDGGLTFTEQGENYSLGKSGSAVSVDGRTKLFSNTDIFLSYSRQDPYYSVTNSISSQGSQKYLATAVTKLSESLSAGITHITQKYFKGTVAENIFGARDSHTTTGILDYRRGKWDLRGEYQHQEVKHPITDYTYFGTLPVLDNDFIAVRVGYQLFSWLHPYIRGQLTLNGKANDQGTLGADINIGRNTILNISETVGTLGDSTLVGLTTKVTEDTDVYANLEVGNHMRLGKYAKTTYGQSTQLGPESRAYVETDYSSYRENIVRGTVLGYDKEITDTLALGLSYERSNVKNHSRAIDRDAGSVALSYLNTDFMHGLKAYTKLECRNDRGTTEVRQWVTENDLLWRLTEGLTISGRGNWGWTEDRTTDTDEAEFYELGTGFSFRPVSWDRLNILGKYSYLTDLPPDSQWDFAEDIESRKHVYAIEGAFDVFRYLQLVGKFAYKDQKEKVGPRDWTDSDTYLYIARSNFHIMNAEKNKPFLLRGWDLGVEYRILKNTQIEDNKEGFLVELDKDIGNYLRFGIGYNFTDYDDDLRNSDEWDSKGWFVKVSGKY